MAAWSAWMIPQIPQRILQAAKICEDLTSRDSCVRRSSASNFRREVWTQSLLFAGSFQHSGCGIP